MGADPDRAEFIQSCLYGQTVKGSVMGYWNSSGMKQCLHSLQESEKRIRRIADECGALILSGEVKADDSAFIGKMEQILLRTAGLEASAAECILKTEQLYTRYEQQIADYFDLAIVKLPRTEVGISTLNSLREHEAQMPFEK